MTDHYNITFRVCDLVTTDLSKLEIIVEMAEEVISAIFAGCDSDAVLRYDGIYSDMEKVEE